VNIENGCVYIPIYATQIMDEVVVQLYQNGAATGAKLSMTPMYYLKAVMSALTGDEYATTRALVQAIATYAGEAVSIAEKRVGAYYGDKTETLAQLQLDGNGGLADVIKLKDGRFIIIDGGVSAGKANTARLYDYLMAHNNYQKPVIAAWVFTHYDGDHTESAFNLLTGHQNKLDVQQIIYCFQDNAEVFKNADTGEFNDNEHAENAYNLTASRKAAFAKIQELYKDTTAFASTEYVKLCNFIDGLAHPDYPAYVKMEVLVSVETDTANGTSNSHNDWSAALKFTFISGKTFLTFGDCTETRMKWLHNTYGTAMESDVVQATHHGLVGGYQATYEDAMKEGSSIVLWPTTYEVLYNKARNILLTEIPHYYYNQAYNEFLRNNSVSVKSPIDNSQLGGFDGELYHDTTYVINMADLVVTEWAQ
jgi:glyoxylase-like metal-dependent hydrolase (beta-lactamase superfamily II)